MIRCEPTELDGVYTITPRVLADERGFFMETYNLQKYRSAGIDRTFVQDNYSHSCRGTVRGLHYQLHSPQAKLVSVVWGEIYDVAVDIRVGSPTFGGWVGQVLSEKNRCQLYIPEGFAHGFCVLSEQADVMYKCTDFYDKDDDYGILWSDPSVGIEWPNIQTILSEKDRLLLPLADVPRDRLPVYRD